MRQRIDSYIKRQLAAVNSDDFSGIKSTAARASALGFVASANSRYVEFLEAFRATPDLEARYAECYPTCCFVPWKGFHQMRKTLRLWCELPAFYVGAIPESELAMLELFEGLGGVQDRDLPRVTDYPEMFPDLASDGLRIITGDYRTLPNHINISVASRLYATFEGFMREARNSFFVVAPAEAFSSTHDWFERVRRMVSDTMRKTTTPPDDPLVIRFVHGGVLVVASWGEEGAWLNRAVAEQQKPTTPV